MTTSTEDNELMSFRRIAMRLGISETQVRRDFQAAMVKLRKALEEAGVTEEEFQAWLHWKDQNGQ